MNIYYLKANSNDSSSIVNVGGAYGKARKDAYQYFEDISAKPIGVYAYIWDDEPQISLNSRMDGMLGILSSEDIVIQSYPTAVNSPVHTRALITKVKFFGSKIIAYIHDIGVFRATSIEEEKGLIDIPGVFNYTKEILNMYDGIIVPTIEMKNKIQASFDYMGKITVQGPYGYINKFKPTKRVLSNKLVYAGSLSKANFLNEVISKNPNISFNLYGTLKPEFGREEFSLVKQSNVTYFGEFSEDIIANLLEGSFGLIWDSDSYVNVTGGMGQYQLINSPHKFSMYISAGLPVIVWKSSAISQYVKDNDLGWAIENLKDLRELFNKISVSEYQHVQHSVQQYSHKINAGIGLKRALFEIIDSL